MSEKEGPSKLTSVQREIRSLRIQSDQLLIESKVQPMSVSRALGDLVNYIEEHRAEDKLAHGFSGSKDNPWSDLPKSGGCIIM